MENSQQNCYESNEDNIVWWAAITEMIAKVKTEVASG